MAHSLKYLLWFASGLFFLASGCSTETQSDKPESPVTETMPAEMPNDFYVAVREMGGSEPFDNVYYLSLDSGSREAYYYDFHSVNAYSVKRADAEAVYQKLRAASPWDIGVETDQVNRVYDRGGELFEIGMEGCHIKRSNAENSHISEGSMADFQAVVTAVRNEVTKQLRPQLQAINLDILYKDGGSAVTMLRVTANDFPLLNWEGSGKVEAPPSTGKNAVLPGNYHLYVHVKTEKGFYSAQDTLQVGGQARQIALELFNGGVEIKKLY